MGSLLHADIFFLITTVAVVLVAFGIVVALYYIIRILRDARYIADRALEESSAIIDDVDQLRQMTRKGGSNFLGFLNLFFRRANRVRKKPPYLKRRN